MTHHVKCKRQGGGGVDSDKYRDLRPREGHGKLKFSLGETLPGGTQVRSRDPISEDQCQGLWP